jgi:hypothetical protein
MVIDKPLVNIAPNGLRLSTGKTDEEGIVMPFIKANPFNPLRPIVICYAKSKVVVPGKNNRCSKNRVVVNLKTKIISG